MIKRICEIASPSGGEERLKEFIVNELENFTDLYFEDTFGNLVFIKKGKGKRICIECGIDEPFLMVAESYDEKLRFSAPPHIKASDFANKDVCFCDQISCLVESEKEEDIKFCHLFSSYEGAKNTGECVTLLPYFKRDEKTFSAFNIIYKTPVYVLINAIKTIKENTDELYFIFSVQKCLANRGVRALMQSGIEFDKAICIACISEKEEGVSIIAKEKSCIPTPEIRKELLYLARENNISLKVSLVEDNFNMKTYLTEGKGVPCGLICIPCTENSVSISDIKTAEKLIAALCEKRS